MKAVVCTKYGPPEVLKLADIDIPVPEDNEVLIKIHSTTCHRGDVRVRSFNVPFWQKLPFRLYLGIMKPKRSILGMELSGDIAETGKKVSRFKKGDRVFATSGFMFGAYAEYITLPVDSPDVNKGLVALMPSNMNYQEAAAGTATGGLTALGILKKAAIKEGQKILIYGASGSVGLFAVQLSKYFGAEVTGVCSGGNMDMVKSLGADRVIDYTKDSLNSDEGNYDIVFDAVNKMDKAAGKRLLKSRGLYFNVDRDTSPAGAVTTEDLEFLKKLVEEGKLKTVIDRYYPLEEIVEAHRYVEKGHKKGHVVINIQ